MGGLNVPIIFLPGLTAFHRQDAYPMQTLIPVAEMGIIKVEVVGITCMESH